MPLTTYQIDRIRQLAKSRPVEEALEYANQLLEGHGVEYVPGARDPIAPAANGSGLTGISYVNMGETYRNTVIYDHAVHRFYWNTSWGDFIERAPIGRFPVSAG